MFEAGNAFENLLIEKNTKNKYEDDGIKIDLKNPRGSHAILASVVKNNSVCLDVGCAVGYIGDALNKEKKCIVYGIEIDKQARKIAERKKCYKEIYDFSITDYKNETYKNFFSNNIKYDYIIFADVLEHLYEPDEVIKNFAEKLKENGKMLISIPNMGHMDISKNLIDRTFNYNTTGLLDNTHIRFFTKDSFIQMIDSINKKYNLNLGIKIIDKTILIPSYVDKYPHLYKLLNEDSELCVFQYIFEINKTGKKSKFKFEKKDYYDKIELQLCEREDFFNRVKSKQKEIAEVKKENLQLKENQKQILHEKEQILKTKEELENNLMFLNKENKILSTELNELLNSKSWKITKPLRKLKQIMKKQD